ncbi:MAG: NAD(P)/FAD-dependent oxidoreductase [Asgard group archaeon]|nr:NAD(P)/FAD-dependent oxidoreductase [Asgard group archaeon]
MVIKEWWNYRLSRKVAIIGAGIAGLSTGCYLHKFGFETEIFEANSKAGGLCCWWYREDFRVDGCFRWLFGLKPSGEMYPLWKDIIPIDELDIHYFDELCQIIDSDGEIFRVFIDINKLEEEMLRIAPEDNKQIRKFIKLAKKFKHITLPILKPIKLMSLKEKLAFILKILLRGRLVLKVSRMMCLDYAEKFQNPLLKRYFTNIYLPIYPFIAVVVNINWLVAEGVGYPIGGSKTLVETFVGEYEKGGGKIHYNSLVEKIIIEDKQAKGIITAKGEKHYFDYIVSTGDGHETLSKLIGKEYLDRKLRYWFFNSNVEAGSVIYISIGLKGKNFRKTGHRFYFPCGEPIVIHKGHEITKFEAFFYDFDPTTSPEGHTLLTIFFNPGDENYWIELREKNKAAYNKEKNKILNDVIDRLGKHLGELGDKIVFTDIATPATYKRYTRNWKGAIQGWNITPKVFKKIIPKTVKGLKRFYMTGQWIEIFGGIPNSLKGGRHVAQLIAHDFKKRKG